MGSYNCLVDLIGHPHLGGKTLLYMIDGLYAARNQKRRGDPLRLVRRTMDLEPLRLAGPGRHRLGGVGFPAERAEGDRLHGAGRGQLPARGGPGE